MGKKICEGRESLQDNDRVGCPSTSLTDEKVEEVCNLIWSDQHLTIFISTIRERTMKGKRFQTTEEI